MFFMFCSNCVLGSCSNYFCERLKKCWKNNWTAKARMAGTVDHLVDEPKGFTEVKEEPLD